MVIIHILSYLPLLGMKGWRKIITNNFYGFRRCLNICLYTNFMNLGLIVLNLSLKLLLCFYMLLQQHMLKFSAFYEFVTGLLSNTTMIF